MKHLVLACLLLFAIKGYTADRALSKMPERSSDVYSASHALVIGVSDYYGGWPVLAGVRKDVAEVSSALTAHGFNVRKAVNPTRQELISTVDDFIARYGSDADARILVYFAGHGHTLNGTGYVVAKEAKDPAKDTDGFRRGSVPIDYFADKAKGMASRHGLFVFDSCFSGTVFKAMRSIPDFRAEMLSRPAKEFIASGTESQQVPDDSVFRKRFVDGIGGSADANGDGIVTGSELGQFIQTEVTGYSAGVQTPVYGKLSGNDGEFLFFAGKPQTASSSYTAPAESGEKERLLAVIKRAPGSIEANNALKRLREIDDSLKNQPPVTTPERKDRVTTVTSTKITYIRTDTRYPYVVLAPVVAYAAGRRITAAFSVTASNPATFKNLNDRKEMLRSVIGHKIEDAGILPSDSMETVRRKIKDAAAKAMSFVCTKCASGEPVLKGLMIK